MQSVPQRQFSALWDGASEQISRKGKGRWHTNTEPTQTGGECTHSPEGRASPLVSCAAWRRNELRHTQPGKMWNLRIPQAHVCLRETDLKTALIHRKRKDLASSQVERMRPDRVILTAVLVYLFLSHSGNSEARAPTKTRKLHCCRRRMDHVQMASIHSGDDDTFLGEQAAVMLFFIWWRFLKHDVVVWVNFIS